MGDVHLHDAQAVAVGLGHLRVRPRRQSAQRVHDPALPGDGGGDELAERVRERVHGPGREAEGQGEPAPEERSREVGGRRAGQHSRHHHQPVEACAILAQGFLVLASGVDVLEGLCRHQAPRRPAEVLHAHALPQLLLLHVSSIIRYKAEAIFLQKLIVRERFPLTAWQSRRTQAFGRARRRRQPRGQRDSGKPEEEEEEAFDGDGSDFED